ncbi:ABC transporter ATP-binding protein [Saccharothrix coeruleofusca]|uniref:ABC transporter ATP-binding protein n=1 Tax=Saccharothrix coeruleofusca TaxID=33919 RepID=A0A918EHA3_9PSEU|nr:ABC transporter ATP-binding protein [Saccharothrix coeruleofusca]
MSYAHAVTLHSDFPTSVAAVRQALADAGFGVLTEIDVTATLKAKLDQDIEPYLILGACNPPLAHRALEVDRSIGLLLPCNVVVRAQGSATLVEILDPITMVQVTGRQELGPVARDAAQRLDAALASLRT